MPPRTAHDANGRYEFARQRLRCLRSARRRAKRGQTAGPEPDVLPRPRCVPSTTKTGRTRSAICRLAGIEGHVRGHCRHPGRMEQIVQHREEWAAERLPDGPAPPPECDGEYPMTAPAATSAQDGSTQRTWGVLSATDNARGSANTAAVSFNPTASPISRPDQPAARSQGPHGTIGRAARRSSGRIPPSQGSRLACRQTSCRLLPRRWSRKYRS